MNRILILQENRANQRLLKAHLEPHYRVVAPELDGDGVDALLRQASFDLGIVDGVTMDRYERVIEARKASAGTIFQPFLLITTRRDINLATRHLWRTVDDVILSPIDRVELLARVEIMLRARRFSLESEERYFTLAGKSPVGVVIVQDDHVVYCNEACRGLLDLSPEVAPHDRFLEWIHQEDRHILVGPDAGGREAASALPVEVRLACRTLERWSELYRARITYRGRTATLFLISDISARKETERALLRAKQQAEELAALKDAVLTNLSHEVRTPLAGIMGFSSMLADTGEDEVREFAELIYTSGTRLLRTLNSVLELAQLEGNAVPFTTRTVDLQLEVREVLQTFLPRLHENALSITTEFPAEPILVEADEAALGRVLDNLMDNAIKFTKAGGITVRVDARAGHGCVSIADTGVGIAPDFMPQLFEDFRQESGGMARSFEGVGIGLAITRRLVELMHGSIEVQTEKGVGSVFTVSLPLAPRTGAPAAG